MKNFKSLLPFLLMLFVWAGCDTDDLRNDVDELKNRVESLEAQVSAINDNMNVLKVLTDGKQTIQSCVYDEASNSYKLVLSDNTELTLTQGKQGTVSYPQITISQNGTWVINGEDTGRKAVGDNAPTPKFAIDANGYWTVDFGNGATQVLDADGQPVLATTSGSVTVTDEFFKDVDVVNGELVVTLQNDEVYSLPIVEALVCDIQTENVNEFKNGVLTVGYGQEVLLNVVVKGDNAFVSAPAGWTAVLGEPDAQTNIAVLTLKAPAESAASTTLGRAATADNTKDLTVQVNKGVAWAVDKIQVEATKVISSYYAEWLAGNNIIVGQVGDEAGSHTVVINNTDYSNATLVESDMTITADGVFFIKEGINVSFSKGALKNSILIGDNPNKRVTVTLNQYLPLKDTGKGFIAKNIDFVLKSGATFNYIGQTTGSGTLDNFILDNCSIEIPEGKNFFNINQDGVTINNIVLVNSSFKMSGNWTATRFFNATKAFTYNSIYIKNNVFYSPVVGNAINGSLVFASGFDLSGNITVSNNTFVNFISASQSLVRGVIKANVTLQNNLFWTDETTNRNATFINAEGSEAGTYVISDNIQYNGSTSTIKFNYFGGTTPTGQTNTLLSVEETNPFDGGEYDRTNGIFVPNATYAEYGAKFE